MSTTPEDYGPDMHARFVEDFIDKNQERPFFVYYTMCLTRTAYADAIVV